MQMIVCSAGRLASRGLLMTQFMAYAAQVETLKLGWCKIGADKGAKAIADLLMFNQSLVSFGIRQLTLHLV